MTFCLQVDVYNTTKVYCRMTYVYISDHPLAFYVSRYRGVLLVPGELDLEVSLVQDRRRSDIFA